MREDCFSLDLGDSKLTLQPRELTLLGELTFASRGGAGVGRFLAPLSQPDGRRCRAARTAVLLSSHHPGASNLLPQITNSSKEKCKPLNLEAAAGRAKG